MATKTMFKDVLDYIFIDNGNAPESFLLSNDVVSASSSSSSSHVAASNATSFFMADSSSSNEIFSNSSSTSAAPTSSSEASSSATENLYSSVAYGLSTLYMNDSFLLDLNTTTTATTATATMAMTTTTTATMAMTTTTLFGVLANGSDLNINGTDDETTSEDIAELVKMAATTIVLGLMILITIIGNVFVIAAIILERNLQNVANYLVASLAVADLLVACLVMPLGAVYEISQGWILGPELCDIWTSCDVLCCTASILHLVAIATDRYWAVTNIDYMHSRTSRRIFLMIFMVWFAAVIVSLAPQFGWKDPDYLQRIEQQKCMVSQDVAYQVFATCCTFYVPLLVILALYWKIYQTARKRIHRRRPRPIDVTANNNQPDLSQKKRKRLRLRIGKFSGEKGKSGPTLGLVEGNSTNTVNTVEDTEFSSSNMDSKSRGGIEVTTNFSCTEEPTTSTSQISTVSHLVALASQQHQHQQLQHQHPLTSTTTATTVSNKFEHNQNVHNSHQLQQHLHDHHQLHHPHQQHPQQSTKKVAPAAAVVNGDCTTPTTTTTTTDKTLAPPTTLAIATATAALPSQTTTTTTTTITTAINNAADSGDVLEDHQLQQQIQQQVAATATATEAPEATVATVADTNTATSDAATLNDNTVTNHDAVAVASVVGAAGSAAATSAGGGGGATTASAATTITSISAISPQTPLNPSGGISLAPAGTTTIAVAINAQHQQQHQQHHPQPHHPPHQLQSSGNASNQVTPLTQPKQSSHLSSIPNPHSKVTKRKETLEAKRERKAAKTLAIITGAFVVCWLPFFVMALLLPLCGDCEINDAIASFFLWMGYFNSTLNPVIYTIFSPEFRQAFKRILFGGHRPVHYRSGKM